jgi:hypothetical protein
MVKGVHWLLEAVNEELSYKGGWMLGYGRWGNDQHLIQDEKSGTCMACREQHKEMK